MGVCGAPPRKDCMIIDIYTVVPERDEWGVTLLMEGDRGVLSIGCRISSLGSTPHRQCRSLPPHPVSSSSGSKLAAPDHSRIRSVCRRYKELVRVLRELDGSCMAKLRQVYSQAVNMLIRCGAIRADIMTA